MMQSRFSEIRLPLLATIALVPVLLVSACGGAPEEGDPMAEEDPAATAALNDQLMVDPDLANQNEGNAALTGGSSAVLPPENATPEAMAAARDEAAALVGGLAKMAAPPAATEVEGGAEPTAALTAAARAMVAPDGANCAEKVQYSAAWAAKLPDALPVYPRGSTQEAAGTDEGNCSLRVVNFLTPVPLNDVLAFYNTRASTGGYSVEHVKQEGDNVLSGTKGSAAYVIYARRHQNGVTEVELVTSGG
ncbi:MAG: hypothetical protein R3E18_02850 [Sphingomonadaceae bacterium]